MKKIILISFLSVLLQGCIAGAFVAGGAAGGTVIGDNRNLETMAADSKISFQAEQHIMADPQLANRAHIVVATYNRVLLLAGQAPTPALREEAVQAVQGVANTRRIFNEITLDKPTSEIVRSKDAAITTNLKTRMLTTTNLKSNQFKVVTENGTVFLMGLTTRQQADIAATVARNSTGVKRVVKLVEYISNSDDAS